MLPDLVEPDIFCLLREATSAEAFPGEGHGQAPVFSACLALGQHLFSMNRCGV
jgi:hypothetical protein